MRRCLGQLAFRTCLALATALPAGCGGSAPSGTPSPPAPAPPDQAATTPRARDTGKRGKKGAAKLPTFRDYFKKKQGQGAGAGAAP